MNDKEKIKKAETFIASFLVRTNTNLKKYASSKDLPEKESVIEILESQKRVLEKIKEILDLDSDFLFYTKFILDKIFYTCLLEFFCT